jgi:PPIC-type PPIASE domain
MRSLSRRLGPVAAAAMLLGVGYFFGSVKAVPLAAQPAVKGVVPAAGTAPAAAPPAAGDKRVIAYINGSMPISREEFGDYLIQLIGRERVRMYVNRRIIEAAAAQRGISVTPQEVSAIIDQDCSKLGMKKDEFLGKVLMQKYGKTEMEWREDVIKPRLMVQAMCKSQLKIDDVELKKVFDNLYGEKVQCKVILWPKGSEKDVLRAYDAIRAPDGKAFDDAARSQPYSDLQARGGMVDPIGRNSGQGTAKIEEIAFRLKDGQVSEMIDTGNGLLVIKRIKVIPPRADVTFESVRPQLVQEATDRQMDQLVPQIFAKLNDDAHPLFILSPKDETPKEVEEKSKRLGVDPSALEPKK